MNEYTSEFLRLAACYLDGLQANIHNKIGVQMVLSVQEARNLALKVELMYQEKTRTENYRRYGGVTTNK